MNKVYIKTLSIDLDKFLKWAGVVSTGGEAKNIIADGLVKVNDVVEKRRSKKLLPGDVVEIFDEKYIVEHQGREN
ncbi:MAG TPA: RNA-binding S4 domain-containing protein [Thermoanaerobacterales bacterium]|nr:RNA-binding S4 domain-containing protein [Thermoanaerobacterales bacterium]